MMFHLASGPLERRLFRVPLGSRIQLRAVVMLYLFKFLSYTGLAARVGERGLGCMTPRDRHTAGGKTFPVTPSFFVSL